MRGTSMEYTDYELKRASQIAYYKINKQHFPFA